MRARSRALVLGGLIAAAALFFSGTAPAQTAMPSDASRAVAFSDKIHALSEHFSQAYVVADSAASRCSVADVQAQLNRMERALAEAHGLAELAQGAGPIAADSAKLAANAEKMMGDSLATVKSEAWWNYKCGTLVYYDDGHLVAERRRAGTYPRPKWLGPAIATVTPEQPNAAPHDNAPDSSFARSARGALEGARYAASKCDPDALEAAIRELQRLLELNADARPAEYDIVRAQLKEAQELRERCNPSVLEPSQSWTFGRNDKSSSKQPARLINLPLGQKPPSGRPQEEKRKEESNTEPKP